MTLSDKITIEKNTSNPVVKQNNRKTKLCYNVNSYPAGTESDLVFATSIEPAQASVHIHAVWLGSIYCWLRPTSSSVGRIITVFLFKLWYFSLKCKITSLTNTKNTFCMPKGKISGPLCRFQTILKFWKFSEEMNPLVWPWPLSGLDKNQSLESIQNIWIPFFLSITLINHNNKLTVTRFHPIYIKNTFSAIYSKFPKWPEKSLSKQCNKWKQKKYCATVVGDNIGLS